jgi:peptidoglycan/xylan/chitin deacetylase (PgdA/CDA1 family)
MTEHDAEIREASERLPLVVPGSQEGNGARRSYTRRPTGPVKWPAGERLAVNFIINYEEGAEQNVLEGDPNNDPPPLVGGAPAGQRDLRAEGFFEYGARVGVWRLLDLFEGYGIRVTFQVSAVAVERNPEVGRAIQAGDHEPCGHGWRWEETFSMDPDTELERIRMAVLSIAKTCGARPYGWLSRNRPSIHTRSLLVQEGGFLYDSNAWDDELPYFVMVGSMQHLVIPYTATYNDARLMVPGGYSNSAQFADECCRALQQLWDEGSTHPKLATIALHARIAGEPSRISAIADIVRFAIGLRDTWIARRVDIAKWWIAQYGTDEKAAN